MRRLVGQRSAAWGPIAVAASAFLVSLVLGVAAASAGSGGVGPGGGGETGGGGGGADRCARAQFGERALERGDCGGDVETLNWILKARNYGVSLDRRFDRSTDRAVRDVQRDKDLKASGVVNSRTRRLIVAGMNNPVASWYGPGFFGNRTACGQTLRRKTVGVAHRRLPCGTKVVIGYGGRFIRTRVIDRGPYVKRNYSRDFDLTRALARKLHFDGADRVRSAVVG